MFTLGMVLALVCLGFSAKSQTEMTNQQKASYAIGHNVGNGMSHDGIELDYEAFVQGVKDAYAGTNKFTDEQMQEIFMQLQQDIQAKKQSGTAAEIAKGAQFLAENKKNPDVKETASGLPPRSEKTMPHPAKIGRTRHILGQNPFQRGLKHA